MFCQGGTTIFAKFASKPNCIFYTICIFSVFVVGPYFLSISVKNLHSRPIILQTSFESAQDLPQIKPGKVLTRNFEQRRSNPVTFMVYDSVRLKRLTLNGKAEIRLTPTTQRRKATELSVPYKGLLFVVS